MFYKMLSETGRAFELTYTENKKSQK